ncbi:heterokaryon incompatibility protein-domain-containing protein [Xylariaceae sp. FL0662B]|nr:heterokaryon incompatibility protein-domain-containing protein [Xylariaceae sp. FL0662B]
MPVLDYRGVMIGFTRTQLGSWLCNAEHAKTFPNLGQQNGSDSSRHKVHRRYLPASLSRSLLLKHYQAMICQNCQDADIRGALEKKFYDDHTGVYYPRIRRKSNHDTLWALKTTESCQFCSFLRATCRNPKTFDDNKNKHIYPTADSGLFLLWIGEYYADNFQKFGAIPPGHKDEVTVQDGAMYQKPPLINCYDRIRNYILTCQSSHEAKEWPSCQADDGMPLLVPLKVLDCQTRNIVRTPSNYPYLVLSYVWGSKTPSFDGPKYPATIEDAITVTLRLGYQYLWVDQYCINQNSAEKMIHIQQMDRIYRNAEACITAAAGDNYNHGLPGVNSPRQAKPTDHGVQFDGLTLLKYDRPPLNSSIGKSKWWQRGWTFQELLFARRRIYFTDNEVLVECACCTIREGLPWEHTPNSDNITLEKGSKTYKTLARYTWPVTDVHTQLYRELIPEYTNRHLTQPNDIIEAFAGVFNSMNDLDHIWGIPIFSTANYSHLVWFLYGLTWCADLPYGEVRCPRRSGFPSWSWAGWYGKINYLKTPPHTSKYKYVGKVWIEQSSGSEVDFQQYESARSDLSAGDVATTSIQFIHLECRCVSIQLRWIKGGAVRVFVGQERNFWFDCHGISIRSDMDIAFGQGPQHTINCVGLCLDDVDSAVFQNNLIPAGMNWTDGNLSENMSTISRCQLLIYNMGDHWERVGGFFFTNYFKNMRSCRLVKEEEPGEGVYEDDYSRFPNRGDYEKWWKMVSVETQKFRLG